MVYSKENYKFDLGVQWLNECILVLLFPFAAIICSCHATASLPFQGLLWLEPHSFECRS